MFTIQDTENIKEMYNENIGWGQEATLYNKIEDVQAVIISNKFTHSWIKRTVIVNQLTILKSGPACEFLK